MTITIFVRSLLHRELELLDISYPTVEESAFLGSIDAGDKWPAGAHDPHVLLATLDRVTIDGCQ
jgi:hypothetical protein